MLVASLLLALAIALEVVATVVLPRADGFTDPGWSLVVLAGYAAAIWLLSVVVRTLPVSVTYAVWAGVGTAAVAVIAAVFLGEDLGWVKGISLALIVAGVLGLNLAGTH